MGYYVETTLDDNKNQVLSKNTIFQECRQSRSEKK